MTARPVEGPYQVLPTWPRQVVDPYARTVAEVSAATVPDDDTAEATARLLAAAPQLKRACQALLIVARQYDADLTALGKGRNLENVPGLRGHNALDYAQTAIGAATA